jgi:hypothetical protein
VPKGHGRLEILERWLEESAEFGAYPEAEYGWLMWCEVLRRRRYRLSKLSDARG